MMRRSGRRGRYLLQYPEQKIDVEAALVSFVNDQRVIATQKPIALQLLEQNAIGHQLDAGVRPRPIVEANLVAHEPDGVGHGCDLRTNHDSLRIRSVDIAPDPSAPAATRRLEHRRRSTGASSVAARHTNIAARLRTARSRAGLSRIAATAVTSGSTPLPLPRHINSRAELLGKPRRQRPRGNTPRLRVPDEPARPAPGLQAKLRQLRRFARPRCPTNNYNRMASQRLEDLTSMRSNRQCRIVLEPQTILQRPGARAPRAASNAMLRSNRTGAHRPVAGKIRRLSVAAESTVSTAGAAPRCSSTTLGPPPPHAALPTPQRWGQPRPSKDQTRWPTGVTNSQCPETGHRPHLMYNPRPVNEALAERDPGCRLGAF